MGKNVSLECIHIDMCTHIMHINSFYSLENSPKRKVMNAGKESHTHKKNESLWSKYTKEKYS